MIISLRLQREMEKLQPGLSPLGFMWNVTCIGEYKNLLKSGMHKQIIDYTIKYIKNSIVCFITVNMKPD